MSDSQANGDPESIDRRDWSSDVCSSDLGGTVFATSALSYANILGANDRISLCHIGIGGRGHELDWIAAQLKSSHNAEMTTVCDLWSVNREKAVAANSKYYGRAPRAFQYLEDALALKDVDAVLISTPEHSHSPILKMAVEAGKVEEKGTHEQNADIDRERASHYILLPGETTLPPMGIDDLSLEHMANWFECMRSRQQPNASVHAGFAHSVACTMAAQSYWSGKKVFWDAKSETILESKPV